jgi:hypothetical protein
MKRVDIVVSGSVHECPVALFGGRMKFVCLVFKSLSQGKEKTQNLIYRYLSRLLMFFAVEIVEYTDFRANFYAEIYHIFSQAAWWFV